MQMFEEIDEIYTADRIHTLGSLVTRRKTSVSTVPSSVAAEWILQSELNFTQNHIRIDGSQAVFMGDVINNFYAPESKRGSVNVSEEDLLTQAAKASRRNFWISAIVVSVLIVFSLGAAVYWIKVNSKGHAKLINYLEREEWMRRMEENSGCEQKTLELPIRRIIVAHSTGDSCISVESCTKRVREIQFDTQYNFLIGGDGFIYEGRGFNFEGEHTSNKDGSSFNDIGIGIAFIGTFQTDSPNERQIGAFLKFTAYFVKKGLIDEDFIILSHDQLSKPKVPADALFKVLKEISEFYSGKVKS